MREDPFDSHKAYVRHFGVKPMVQLAVVVTIVLMGADVVSKGSSLLSTTSFWVTTGVVFVGTVAAALLVGRILGHWLWRTFEHSDR
jgi:uncharacterized membrane protein YczE